jgi:hypothetical protein
MAQSFPAVCPRFERKKSWSSVSGLPAYLLSTKFILGGTFPKVTIAFISMNLLFFFSFYLISRIKGEKVSTVIDESKTTARGVFFPTLSFLHVHSNLDLLPWIKSFEIEILILLLLIFILKKEDQDQDRKDK